MTDLTVVPPIATWSAPSGSPRAPEVVLLTGDRITVLDEHRLVIDRGAGRAHVRMAVDVVDGVRRVIPEDARRAVSCGRLDVRLFEIETLLAGRHGTPGSPVRVVVSTGGESREATDLISDGGDRWKQMALGLDHEDIHVALDAPPPAATLHHGGGEHRLEVEVAGPDGLPAPAGECLLLGLDDPTRTYLPVVHGLAGIDVGPGVYLLVVDVVTEDGDWHRMVHPAVGVHADTTVRVDARTSRPTALRLDRPDLSPLMVDVGFERRHGGRKVGASLNAVDVDGLNTAHVGPTVETAAMTSGVASVWSDTDQGRPAPHGSVTCHLIDTMDGAFFTGIRRTTATADLAEVHSEHLVQGTSGLAGKGWYPMAPGYVATSGMMLSLELPARIVHLLGGRDAVWSGSFGEQVRDDGGGLVYATTMGSDYRAFAPGDVVTDRWNAATSGPYFFLPEHGARTHDRMWFGVPLFTDQDDHRSGSVCDGVSVALFRDGQLVGQSDGGQVSVPTRPGRARFRIEVDAERGRAFTLSTAVSATWRFTMYAPAHDAGPESMPLWTVRWLPDVDGHNEVARSATAAVDLLLAEQPTAVVGEPEAVSVAVSHDGGASWFDVPVTGSGRRRTAHVPLGNANSVSLRARVRDDRDNELDQTIIDAFRVRTTEDRELAR